MKSIWPTVIMLLIILVATAYIAYSFGQKPQYGGQVPIEEGTTEDTTTKEDLTQAPPRECPDVLIVNRMPQIVSPGEEPQENSYYIINGKTYYPSQVDENWIRTNCQVPTEEVY